MLLTNLHIDVLLSVQTEELGAFPVMIVLPFAFGVVFSSVLCSSAKIVVNMIFISFVFPLLPT